MPLFFSGKAYLPVPDASGGGAAEVSFKNPRRATPSDGALGLTIAPRLEPQEITWQLVDASIAISIGSACSVRTSVRHGPLSLPNHMGQPIFAAARDAGWQPRRAGRHDPPAGPLALLSPIKRAQALS